MRKAAGRQEGRHVLCKEWDWFRVDSGAAGFEHTMGKKALIKNPGSMMPTQCQPGGKRN